MKKILRREDVEDVLEKTISKDIPKGGGGFLSLHQLEAGKLNLTDREYCVRFGSDEDWKELRARIVERRKTIPAFFWARCKNPKCGWTGKFRTGTPLVHCLRCNWPGYKEHPGWLEEVSSKKEIERLEKAEAERLERGVRRLRELDKKHKELYNAGLVDR